ncbi:MAG TPA: hypothetical protein VHY84_27225, partial [Bryobacteraceae bacterium]|nr:hypothetical protein [Bryobacteraceae bacterium]
SQLDSQLYSQLRLQLYSQLDSQLHSQLDSQLDSQLYSQLDSQLRSQLYSRLRSQLRSQLDSQLRSQLASQLANYFAAQHWCAWQVFYAFCGEIGVRFTPDLQALLDLWLRQSREMHWWFPFDGIVLASERHTQLHVDEEGRLHSGESLACGYGDGWGVYAWHGTVVSERVILQPDKLTPREILDERNSEVRRVMIERFGQDRFMSDAGAKVLDKGNDGELLAIDLPGDPDGRMVALRLRCPSTSAVYVVRVPPDQRDYVAAKAWTFGLTKSEYVFASES